MSDEQANLFSKEELRGTLTGEELVIRFYAALMKREAERDAEKQAGRGPYRMSNLGLAVPDGPCMRSKWLVDQGLAVVPPKKPGQQWMLTQGNRIHDMLQDLFTKGAKEVVGMEVVGIETPVAILSDDMHNWTGHYDLKVRLHNPGHESREFIIDFKTVRGGAFRYLHEPKPANVLQVQGYLMADDCDRGMLVYVDREGQNFMRAFPVHRDDQSVLEAMRTIEAALSAAAPPPPVPIKVDVKPTKTKGDSIYVKEPWQTAYCDLGEGCHCKARFPGVFPSGIAARRQSGTVRIEPGVDSRWATLINEVL
jgi:hypothetical protein